MEISKSAAMSGYRRASVELEPPGDASAGRGLRAGALQCSLSSLSFENCRQINAMTQLATRRLLLVPFSDDHLEGLHALNADPEVMRYLTGRPETREETQAVIARVKQRWATAGYSWWTFIERDSGEVVGAGALQNLRHDMTAEPDPACPLEIGWRLRRDRWKQGLASEAARAMAHHAFDGLKVDELYAVCDPANLASARVMQRLGMQDVGIQTWYGRSVATYRIDAGRWRGLPTKT
jgi:RimJ/RimL family protein N-acetyltransferase